MTDLYETRPEVGVAITATNEHLIPVGSKVQRATKYPTGWHSTGHCATYPVLGLVLTEMGTGPVETLAQYKCRFRATVLSRMDYESVNGMDRVVNALHVLGVGEADHLSPGVTLAWPRDFDAEEVAHLLVDMQAGRMRMGKALHRERMHDTIALVMRVVPINDEPVWTGPENHDGWQGWVQFKRAAWEYGERIASDVGWCGTFQNTMSSLGIDSSFADAVAAEPPLVAANVNATPFDQLLNEEF